MHDQGEASRERIIGGRYALYGPIASGGMATVHFGRQLGAAGFARTVAIKRLKGEFLESAEFVSTLLDEARLASRIRHPNVVATMDMVAMEDELFLVMEYVVGESLSRLLNRLHKRGEPVDPKIATGILCGVLHALHAAHEAVDERGEPLGIVHRDVSPQNILVGVDGLPRLLDFGIAKGKGRLQTTRAGQLKGKVSYMAPEQILGEDPDRRSDVYAAAVVLWEVLTGRRLFPTSDNAGDNFNLIPKILEADIDPPSEVGDVPKIFDGIVMRGLNRAVDARYDTAREFAVALEDEVGVATSRQIGEWVESIAADTLAQRARHVLALEAQSTGTNRKSVERIADDTVKRRRRKRLASQNNEASLLDPPTELDDEQEPSTAPRAHKIADPPTEIDDDDDDGEELKATRVGMARAAEQARSQALAHAKRRAGAETLPAEGVDVDELRRTKQWTRDDLGIDDEESEATTNVYDTGRVLKGPPSLPEDEISTEDDAVSSRAGQGEAATRDDLPMRDIPDPQQAPDAREPESFDADEGDEADDESTLNATGPRPSDFRPSGRASESPDDLVVPVQSNRWLVVVLVIAAAVAAAAAIYKWVGGG